MKVSVMMITYNHERFIAQALESVLAQRVNFDYEIVIGEDCSTDRTREILVDFHRRYPGKIVMQLRERNIGAMRNFKATLAACRGEYIALLEGDDYWISEDKLQRQADFLDSHSDYAISCHRARVLDETGTWEHGSVFPSKPSDTYTISDLLEGNFIMTCSTVYRRNAIGQLPGWFSKMSLGDWPLCALIARRGKIALMDDVMTVYRVHSGGIWSTRPELHRHRETIRMLKALDKHLEFEYTSTIQRTIARYRDYAVGAYLGMARTAREEGNRKATAEHIAGWVRNGGLRRAGSVRVFGSFAAYALFGSWYEAIQKARRASRS